MTQVLIISVNFFSKYLDFGRTSGCRPKDLSGISFRIGNRDSLRSLSHYLGARLDKAKVFRQVLVRTNFDPSDYGLLDFGGQPL